MRMVGFALSWVYLFQTHLLRSVLPNENTYFFLDVPSAHQPNVQMLYRAKYA